MHLLDGAPVALLVTFALAGLILAALLSASEAALHRITRSTVAQLVADRPVPGNRIQRLTQDTERTVHALSFMRIAAEMIATACITVSIAAALDEWWLVVMIAAALSTLISLVLIRMSPRRLGSRRPDVVLGALSGLLTVVAALTQWAISPTPHLQERGGEDDEQQLRELVDRVDESRAIEDEDRDMLRSVIELHETTARAVMVPRTDMVTIDAATPLLKAQRLFVRSGFSRIPVVGTSTDDVLGVLFFKDTARVLLNSSDPHSRTAFDLMRPIAFFPESKNAADLLRDMQESAQHISMIVDEYGGIAGLVTIEDIVEEIVGDLTDEHDVAPQETELTQDGALRVPARMTLDELGDLCDRRLEDPDVDTIAGLFAKGLGMIPIAGSHTTILDLEITADTFHGRRKQLATVLVRDLAAQTTPDHADASLSATHDSKESTL